MPDAQMQAIAAVLPLATPMIPKMSIKIPIILNANTFLFFIVFSSFRSFISFVVLTVMTVIAALTVCIQYTQFAQFCQHLGDIIVYVHIINHFRYSVIVHYIQNREPNCVYHSAVSSLNCIYTVIQKGTGEYDGYPYRSFAPKRFKALRGIVFFPVQLNQNLSISVS